MCAAFSSKSVVCDSSSLISLTDSCFLYLIREMKRKTGVQFLISTRVKYESIDHPAKIKPYALHALRLKDALNRGAITYVNTGNLSQELNEMMNLVNSIYYVDKKPLRIVHEGEAEMLVLSEKLGVSNIMIDERTTRMIIEAPHNLRNHLSKEFHADVSVNEGNLNRFQKRMRNLNIFRSTELLLVAYEKGTFKEFGNLETEFVEAALYGLKFSGCGISFEEIDEYMRGVR